MSNTAKNGSGEDGLEPGAKLVSALSDNGDFELSATLLSYLGPSSFLRMVKSFCEEFDETLTENEESVELEEKRRVAHSLKSAAANIGAVSLSSLAAKTEAAIKAGDDTTFAHLLSQLEDTLELLKKHCA